MFRQINKIELIKGKMFEFIANSSAVQIKYFTVKTTWKQG